MSDDRPLQFHTTRGSTTFSPPLGDEIGPLPEELEDASSHNTSLKKRRTTSKGKVSGVLKRATSTPLIRTLAFTEEGRRSPAARDQKRNKLGYHRTSVACGHCRRRKIRCLPAPDDPQGRCSNCIRLKKECNFYPVEQTPHSERASSSAKPEAASANASASSASSPALPSEVAPSRGTQYDKAMHLHGEPLHQHEGFPMSQTGLGLSIPSSALPNPTTSLYPVDRERQQDWAHAGLGQRAGFAVDEAELAQPAQRSQNPWGTPESPQHPHEHSLSQQSLPLAHAVPLSSQHGYHEMHNPQLVHGWSGPSRSMSFSMVEGSEGFYPSPGFPVHQDISRHPSPYAFPPHVETMHAASVASMSGAAPTAMTAAMKTRQPMQPHQPYTQSPAWQSTVAYGTQVTDAGGGVHGSVAGGQWYAEPVLWDAHEQPHDTPQYHGGHSSFYPEGQGQHER